jgi:hypothetical protein
VIACGFHWLFFLISNLACNPSTTPAAGQRGNCEDRSEPPPLLKTCFSFIIKKKRRELQLWSRMEHGNRTGILQESNPEVGNGGRASGTQERRHPFRREGTGLHAKRRNQNTRSKPRERLDRSLSLDFSLPPALPSPSRAPISSLLPWLCPRGKLVRIARDDESAAAK